MIRTRFAPSPTGYLHVGGIRTALFAWLVARQQGGQFVLRIEDTDRAREMAGAEAHIIDSLKKLGIDYDEGPDMPGDYGPYRQTARLASYQTWAQALVAAGRAYADPYSQAEVQAFREQARQAKKPFLFRHHRPQQLPEWDGTKPLRFKSDPQSYAWHDAVMGDLQAGPEAIDDFILIKSDGFPTYNFAHIIDDHEMAITHIIRGQEFIASQPNYLNLYEALNFEVPVIATVPHILGPDGQKKLSKRDGAKDVLDYLREGFLSEALVNFIASLGWNDGSEQEIFSRDELIAKFRLDRVQRGGARFDENRLLWMNGSWIRSLDIDSLYQRTKAETGFWPESAADYPEQYQKQVLALVQERLKFLAELPQLTSFFFEEPPVNPELIATNKQLKKFDRVELKAMLEQAKDVLAASDFSIDDLTTRLNGLLATIQQKPSVVFSLIRIATTQAPASPGLVDSLAVLGKDRSLKRLDTMLKAIINSH